MSQKKILVIDDSAVIRKTLSMKLTAGGYDVITAQDGATAVRMVRTENPNLIILDLVFPPDVGVGGGVNWDGFTIMSWLKRLEEIKGVPILVATSADPDKFKNRALDAGATDFFHKPLDTDALLGTIQRLLTEQNAPAVTTVQTTS